MLKTGGKTVATIYHVNKPVHVAPTIVDVKTVGGTRFYVDSAGKSHVADMYDAVFGKRDAKAINPKPKFAYQRTFKPNK